MFGRRRRSQVPIERPVTPERETLNADDVYELVNRKVAEALGPEGRYSLVLRSAADTDAIFSQLAARSLSLAITRSIVGAGAAAPRESTHGKRIERESARQEHTAIAMWADPVRHDPDVVDPALVSPPTRAADVRSATATS